MPAIDKDDENATRYEVTAAPMTLDIDAQIAKVKKWSPEFKDVIASLLELKRIRSAERPEPVATCVRQPLRGDEYVARHTITWRNGQPISGDLYGPELLDAYDRMAAERDAALKHQACAALEQDEVGAPCVYLRDANARAEAAESALAKVVKGLREPTEATLNAGLVAAGLWIEPFAPATECGVPIECGLTQAEADEINAAGREDMLNVWKAMSAELLRDLASDATEGRE